MKSCSKCSYSKELVKFAKDSRYKDGRYPSCKECKKKLQSEYYSKNKEEIIKKDVARKVAKYKNDFSYRIKHQLRSRLRTALSRDYRSGVAIDYLGCSIEELKKHLESKFKVNMTWSNHSVHGWHIDHVLPLDAFDLTDIEQIKKACHYTNLQPLWSSDNWLKGNN